MICENAGVEKLITIYGTLGKCFNIL